MEKKGFLILLVLVSIVFTVLLSSNAVAGCCVSESGTGGCYASAPESCTSSYPHYYNYSEDLCTKVGKCTIGCCCTSLVNKVQHKVTCNSKCTGGTCFYKMSWSDSYQGTQLGYAQADHQTECENHCKTPPTIPTGVTLTVVVTDRDDNRLNSVLVEIITDGQSCATNSNGECSFAFSKEQTISIRAKKDGYITQTLSIDLKSGENKRTIKLFPEACNSPNATESPKNLAIKDVFLKPELKSTWENSCDVSSFVIYRCETNSDSCTTNEIYATTATNPFIDTNYGKGLKPETTYCYKIKAKYSAPGKVWEKESKVACERTGIKPCITAETSLDYYEFCNISSRYRCTPENQGIQIQECTTLFGCKSSAKTGKSWCPEIDICRECANPFGMFWNPDLQLPYQDPLNLNQQLPLCSKIDFCYLDYSNTIVDKPYSCYDKGDFSCYDYKSNIACTENKCSENCEFVPYPAYTEFGKGICRPKAIEKQDCGLCNKNTDLFLQCNPQTCLLYGKCYFGKVNGCVGKETIICDDYRVKQDCEADMLGLGVCKWGKPLGEYQDRCYKDANNDGIDDCIQNPELCKDNEPPVTIVDYPRQTTIDLLEIRFSVRDNADKNPKLFFCADLTNQCTPSKLVPDIEGVKKINGKDFNFRGDNRYYFRFFAQDASFNTEPTRSVEVLIGAELVFGPTPIRVVIGTTKIIENGIPQPT